MHPRLSVSWTTRGEKVNDCTKSKMDWTGSHQWVITGNNWTFNPSSNRISFSPIWKIFHFRVENIFLILISTGSATQDAFSPSHRPNISAQDHLIKSTIVIVWSILPEFDGHRNVWVSLTVDLKYDAMMTKCLTSDFINWVEILHTVKPLEILLK